MYPFFTEASIITDFHRLYVHSPYKELIHIHFVNVNVKFFLSYQQAKWFNEEVVVAVVCNTAGYVSGCPTLAPLYVDHSLLGVVHRLDNVILVHTGIIYVVVVLGYTP